MFVLIQKSIKQNCISKAHTLNGILELLNFRLIDLRGMCKKIPIKKERFDKGINGLYMIVSGDFFVEGRKHKVEIYILELAEDDHSEFVFF